MILLKKSQIYDWTKNTSFHIIELDLTEISAALFCLETTEKDFNFNSSHDILDRVELNLKYPSHISYKILAITSESDTKIRIFLSEYSDTTKLYLNYLTSKYRAISSVTYYVNNTLFALVNKNKRVRTYIPYYDKSDVDGYIQLLSNLMNNL